MRKRNDLHTPVPVSLLPPLDLFSPHSGKYHGESFCDYLNVWILCHCGFVLSFGVLLSESLPELTPES